MIKALVTGGNGQLAQCLKEIVKYLSLIHISEPTRQAEISYAVFCLKKKKKKKKNKTINGLDRYKQQY